jgi:hypothetical protein
MRSVNRALIKNAKYIKYLQFLLPSALLALVKIFPDSLKQGEIIVWSLVVLVAAGVLKYYIESLDRKYRNKLTIYNFRNSPHIVTGHFRVGGIVTIPGVDRHAGDILTDDMQNIGIKISGLSPCGNDPAPRQFASDSMILICGPNANSLADDLNEHFRGTQSHAFYFIPLEETEIHVKPTEGEWAIAHGTFRDLIIKTPPLGNIDYGLIYVGKNPRAADKWLIWIAGLGPHGTVGCARTLVDQRVQAMLASHFDAGAEYVSASISYEYTSETEGAVTSVCISPSLA